jgi:hypothetical protein
MTKFISIDDAYLTDAIERYIFNIPLGQILSGTVPKYVDRPDELVKFVRELEKGWPEDITPDKESLDLSDPDPPPEDYTPSGGTWFVAGNGKIRKMDPLKTPEWWKNDMEQALAAGRLFETEEQAQTAAKLQGNFMRFIRRQIDDHPAATEINFSFNFLSKEP